ncbi:MAG: T9SS type A sorting domain-containing protein [Flavobacterium sp.]|nr:T9SS type A sorting domain-containing protein [Flavobacterium sp.]
MKKLLLLITILFFSGFLQAQTWVTQNTGFASASRGLIDIKIVDANTVWALAYDGTAAATTVQEFTKTVNGGTTWTPGTINVGNTTNLITNISPVSATTAWVGSVNSTAGLGGVFKTSDGGLTWVAQNATAYTGAGAYFDSVHFFDANNGLTIGDPVGGEFEVYKTTDGGTTWTQVPGTSLPNPLTNEASYTGGYAYSGTTLWFTTSSGRLYKTPDMGTTWTVSQAPLTDFGGAAQSGAVDFSSPANGCLLKTVGTTISFYTTSDGGNTWSAATTFAGGYNRLLSYIPGTNTIVATGQNATAPSVPGSSYSTNNGTSFTTIDTGTQRGYNTFLNPTTGWSAGFNTSSTVGGIFKFSGNLANETFTKENGFKLFPNPTNGEVSINSMDDAFSLKVIDITGKVLLEKTFSGIENSISISSLSSGVYFFKLTNSENKSQTIKILKN